VALLSVCCKALKRDFVFPSISFYIKIQYHPTTLECFLFEIHLSIIARFQLLIIRIMLSSAPPPLPLSSLPLWSKLNDINFLDTTIQSLSSSKGYGLVSERELSSEETFDRPTLLVIPKDLVLCAETLEEAAKADGGLRVLLEVAGGMVRCHS